MRTNLFSRLLSCLALVVSMLGLSVHAQLTDVTQPGDPIVPTSNNSPGSEGVANAIDNAPTKYLNFDKLNTGFTVTPRVGLTVVQCLTLTSANDAPERDPASFVLSGSYDGTNFVQIAADVVPAFATRFQKITIKFQNNTPYLVYRLIFPTVANAASANSMQISEVELLGFLAPTDVTQPGDPIVATSNNSPGSEGVANAIDNAPTKYLNFDKLNTGFTVTPRVGATLVSGMTLTSANDAPERDPASYTLEGSLDGISFFPIANGPVPAFPSRFYKNFIFFPNSRAFLSYRLVFPTVSNAASANSMQISEVELLGDVADLAQDITLPGDPIIPTSNNSPGSEGVANAIDNAPTKYLNFDKLNTGFTVNPGARGLTVVNGLTLTSANDAPERDPASYTLSGSYDGTNFTQIAAGPVPAFPSRFFKNTILFPNQVPYLQYQLIFPTVSNAASANSMQISEVELLGLLADTDVTTPGDPVVASSNNSPGSEGVANAIDNAPTKYLNFDKLNTGFTVTPRVGGTILIGLSLTSANDAPERDPASYVLTGSEDGSNFVAISSGAVPAFPGRFVKNYVFFPDNTKEFGSYRLVFPTVSNAASANSMQISEVEFLGHQRGGGSCTIETNGVLIGRQPEDTPVLLGSTATFRVGLTGPWKVQWFRNGVAIPGANNATYTTPVATAGDDGTRYQAKVGPATVGGIRGQCETSAEVLLSIFAPSTTESIGVSWVGGGANGAPTAMLPTDITGFNKQAYWNNLVGGSGSLPNPINSSNVANPTITVTWATSGEWGVGTGNGLPAERLYNGTSTSFSTDEGSAQTVTLSGVPAGNHSLFLYTVQVPQEFFKMDFSVVTHDAGGGDVIQRRYIRPLNSDEYNPLPGFFLVPSDTPETRGVGSMMRFDNVQPGPDGIILVRFFSPGRIDLPGGDPIRGPGLNALQLCLNPPSAGAPPVITRHPVSANGIVGGCATFSVDATGPGLTYQWYKNGLPIRGATSPQLAVLNLRTNDAGNYIVIVSNPAGSVRSSIAVVEVLPSNQFSLGLISYFKFDDAGGVTTLNSAPGGQNGQVQGTFPSAVPGQIGNGLALNGSDNYVFVPNYPKVSRDLTVSGWVQPFNVGPLVNNWVEGQVTGSSGQFLLDLINDNGNLTVRAQIEVGPNRVLATAVLDATQGDPFLWHHFVMTANGVTLSIYWDGQLIATADYLGTINTTPSLPWLSIGAALNTSQQPDPIITPNLLSGNIDDVALWNRNLSAIEIQALYGAGLAGRDVSQTPPVLTPGECPPTITCPGNISAECTGALTPVNFTVTATDSSGNPVPVTCVPPSGTGFRLGQSNVVCMAAIGTQVSSCSFRVTVVDTTPPTVNCNSNIIASATGPNGAVVTYSASAVDACGIGTLICAPPSGGTFPAGTTTVICQATDNAGNSNSCNFTVTVNQSQPPTINCPPSLVGECGVPVSYPVTATDSSGTPLPVICVPPSGTILPVGVTNVTCTATDSGGRSSSCSFRLTTADTTPPRVVCPGNISVTVTNANGANVPFAVSCFDQCSIMRLTCTPSTNFFPIGTTTVSCTCIDQAGNSNSCSFTVTVNTPNRCPSAVAKAGPNCELSAGQTATVVIAGNNSNACVSLDGSMSSDSDNDTLTYVWLADVNGDGTKEPIATTAVSTNCLPVGSYEVMLMVDDGHCSATASVTVEVITPCEAVEQIIMAVENADLDRRNKRPLIATLKAACASFERGSCDSGVGQLNAFQNKVRAQVGRTQPDVADALITLTDHIIGCIHCD